MDSVSSVWLVSTMYYTASWLTMAVFEVREATVENVQRKQARSGAEREEEGGEEPAEAGDDSDGTEEDDDGLTLLLLFLFLLILLCGLFYKPLYLHVSPFPFSERLHVLPWITILIKPIPIDVCTISFPGLL